MIATVEKSEVQIKKMNERIIKNFLDIIIMSELRNGPLSGYDIISYIHNKFQLLVSSGTIYSLLYSLERMTSSKAYGMKEKEPINSQKKVHTQ